MRRRAWLCAGAAALIAVTAAAVALSTGSGRTAAAVQEPPPTTAEVERGDLSSMVSLNGTLTYRARPDGSPYPAINQARGMYTWLPAEGDRVGCGDVLYRVDDDPVLLLCGTVPAYRDLGPGDVGRDVRRLNRSLGVPDGSVFTRRTAKALRRLRRDTGSHGAGELALGDAVFLPRPVRIAKVTARLGGAARPGAQAMQATSTTLEVQVGLDASQQGAVRRGDRARIALPGSRSASGEVARLGRVARTAEEDDVAGATIPASIRLDEPRQARGLDRAPVRVEIATEGVKGVLSVPVTALLGRSGGGFAVEVVRDDGRRGLVAVELGLFDTTGGRVEVEGALGEGDRVVVPAP